MKKQRNLRFYIGKAVHLIILLMIFPILPCIIGGTENVSLIPLWFALIGVELLWGMWKLFRRLLRPLSPKTTSQK